LTLRNDCITVVGVTTVFSGLADPTRMRIVELLAEKGELPAGKIAEHFGSMTRAAVSRHLRSLEDAGFVVVTVDAQRRVYRLNPGPFVEMDAWLNRYRRFWGTKFGTLQKHVEQREGTDDNTTSRRAIRPRQQPRPVRRRRSD
jgi:DNA-binding transcriptional ArsR family regulator